MQSFDHARASPSSGGTQRLQAEAGESSQRRFVVDVQVRAGDERILTRERG
jgi:hypothetical protein